MTQYISKAFNLYLKKHNFSLKIISTPFWSVKGNCNARSATWKLIFFSEAKQLSLVKILQLHLNIIIHRNLQNVNSIFHKHKTFKKQEEYWKFRIMVQNLESQKQDKDNKTKKSPQQLIRMNLTSNSYWNALHSHNEKN